MLAGVIGAMDIAATRSENQARSSEAKEWLAEANEHLKDAAAALEELKNSPDASTEDIVIATEKYNAALKEQQEQEAYAKRVEQLNAAEMAQSTGGAIGSTAGTVLGGVLGSLAGPVGTQIGMAIGGVVGEVIGTKAGELATESPKKLLSEIGPTVEDEFGNEVAVPGAEVSAAEGLRALREETIDTAQTIADEMQSEVDSVDAALAAVAVDVTRNATEAAAASAQAMQNDFISPTKEAYVNAANAMKDASVNAAEESKSVWGSLAGWFSSLFSGFGGGANVAHNASGTSYFGGGWTEVGEHGGEIIDLPVGSRIYPHATTMEMLRHEIASAAGSFAPQVPSFGSIIAAAGGEESSPSAGGNSAPGSPSIHISGNEFVIREDADIQRIAYELFRLFSQQAGNFQFTGGAV